MEISKERLVELEDIERVMSCLDAGGVDNWEGYDDALEGYREEKENMEEIEAKFYDLLEVLCTGIDEPAGSGCGYGFTEDAQEQGLTLFTNVINEFKKQ